MGFMADITKHATKGGRANVEKTRCFSLVSINDSAVSTTRRSWVLSRSRCAFRGMILGQEFHPSQEYAGSVEWLLHRLRLLVVATV